MTTGISNRDLEQRIVWNAWRDAGYWGTYIGTTGVGKTKIGVMPTGYFITQGIINQDEAIIITPTENLRDNEWPNEFDKWGYSKEKEKVIIECIQTAFRRKGHHFKLCIVDEIHTALSVEYREFFLNNTFDRVLWLSATVHDPEKLEFLNRFAPVFYRTPLARALELKLVSPFIVYNLAIQLNPEELEEYIVIDKMIDEMFPKFNSSLEFLYKCMSSEFFRKYCYDNSIEYEKYKNWPYSCNAAIVRRRSILYNASEKITVAKQISDLAIDRKAIFFSESQDYADKLHETIGVKSVVYHSGINKREKKEALRLFGDDTSGVTRMCAVKALNAGHNVPSCSLGVIASGNSIALDLLQRLGRTIRWEKDKQAIFIQLYFPGYASKSRLTGEDIFIQSQEYKWIWKRSKSVPSVSWIDNIANIKELQDEFKN